jgi:hypothetical protein
MYIEPCMNHVLLLDKDNILKDPNLKILQTIIVYQS